MEFLLVIVLILMIPAGWVLCQNSLVAARNKVSEAWSGITVQLKRRHALVPNLVQAAKSAMAHESGVIDRILEARVTALEALKTNEPNAVNAAEAGLSQALSNFIGYSEDNPELSANENLRLLQSQLEETEDQIAAARRLYNGNVQAYNTKTQLIPWSFVAANGRFPLAELFSVSEVEMKTISKDVSIADLGLSTKE